MKRIRINGEWTSRGSLKQRSFRFNTVNHGPVQRSVSVDLSKNSFSNYRGPFDIVTEIFVKVMKSPFDLSYGHFFIRDLLSHK